MNHLIFELGKMLAEVDPSRFDWIGRVIWWIAAKNRIHKFEIILKALKNNAAAINVDLSKLPERYDVLNIGDYYEALEDCKRQLEQLSEYKEYLRKVHTPQKMPTLEEINRSIF